jgi:hypothetical protein
MNGRAFPHFTAPMAAHGVPGRGTRALTKTTTTITG